MRAVNCNAGLGLALLVLVSGCAKPKPTTGPQGGGGGGGGGINLKVAIDKPRIINDLQEIFRFYNLYETDHDGRPPKNLADFLDYMKKDSAKLAKALEDGDYVVYWGVSRMGLPSGSSNTVLAYYKDVPTQGGQVLMADGSVKAMGAEEFAKAPKMGK